MKFKSIWVILFLSLLILSSCVKAEKITSENKESISENNKELLFSIEESMLDDNEKKVFESLKKNIKLSNQIIEEADLIIEETQYSDELEGALETMDTAVNEVIKILGELQDNSQISNENLKNLDVNFRQSLGNYKEGMKMQFDGITNGDSQKNKEGYLLTDSAKKEIKNYNSQLIGKSQK